MSGFEDHIVRTRAPEGGMLPISIVIALRSPMASELMSHELGRHPRHFKVVAFAHTSKDLLEQVTEHKPAVALISSDLPGESNGGLKVLRGLRASGIPTRPVVLVDFPVPELVVGAFANGARGVISMREPIAVLCKCIRNVEGGHIWANGDQLEWIVESLMARLPFHIVNAKGEPLLTKREEQIVRMIAEGLPNSEISSTLHVSPHTVKNHLFRIYEKLGVSNRAELILYALSN